MCKGLVWAEADALEDEGQERGNLEREVRVRGKGRVSEEEGKERAK